MRRILIGNVKTNSIILQLEIIKKYKNNLVQSNVYFKMNNEDYFKLTLSAFRITIKNNNINYNEEVISKHGKSRHL